VKIFTPFDHRPVPSVPASGFVASVEDSFPPTSQAEPLASKEDVPSHYFIPVALQGLPSALSHLVVPALPRRYSSIQFPFPYIHRGCSSPGLVGTFRVKGRSRCCFGHSSPLVTWPPTYRNASILRVPAPSHPLRMQILACMGASRVTGAHPSPGLCTLVSSST